METKLIGLILCDLLGVTGIGNGLINRIDSVKEAIIFVLAVLYGIVRLYFMARRSDVRLRRELFEQRERERKAREN